VQNFAQKTTQKFDLILSNPPFFENSLKSPKATKNISKHNDFLPLEDLVFAVNLLLSETGRFGVILPVIAAEKLEKIMLTVYLYATKKTRVYPTPTKKANRVIMMFERKLLVCEEDKLIIRDNGYTNEYSELVKEYSYH
jgi:tRNA1Val (adenine37-N6)-methyltransferase